MGEYSDKLNSVDTINFETKKENAIFAGSSTGNLDPKLNDRLRLCNWAVARKEVDCYITNTFPQIGEQKVSEAYPRYKEFTREHIGEKEQLENKFIISVDGNTAAWDRVPWVFNSNSILLKKRSDQLGWYYPFMKNGVHYIEFDNFDEIPSKMRTPDSVCRNIIENSSKFVNDYMKIEPQMDYMSRVLFYSSRKSSTSI